MSKKRIPMLAMAIFSLGAQAQDDHKCPEDPSEFKGKEDDCFDCLEGALSNLKLFTIEVSKTLDEKKLTTVDEAKTMKARSDDLWEGVEGWQKMCELKPGATVGPEAGATEEPETETATEPEAEAAEEPEA